MTSYLLDTNVLSLAVRGRDPAILDRLLATPRARVAMSVITAMELRFGLAKNPDTPHRPAVESLLATIRVEPLGAEVPDTYGRIRADLERRGKPIGALDTIIAAHAVTLGSILVTNNIRELGRVSGLICEDWTEARPARAR